MKGDLQARLQRLEERLRRGDGVVVVNAHSGGYRLPNGRTVTDLGELRGKYDVIIIDDL